MADRVICMSKGRIEQIGTPDDLYERPNSLFVASFIGAPPINLVAGEADGGRVRIGETTLTARNGLDGPVSIGIRPENLAIGAAGAHKLPGRVRQLEPMGRETLYLIDTPLGTLHALEPGTAHRHAMDDMVSLDLATERLLVFDRRTERMVPDAGLDLAA